ncbi:MAG: ECF transporter S component [Chthonomonadales bacterium]
MTRHTIELRSVRQTAAAALLCACGVVVPMIFHAVGLGRVFLPMHLPVLIAGLILAPREAVAVGLITPWASAFLTGMPPFPTASAMSLELAVLAGSASLLVAIGMSPWTATIVAIALRAGVTWLITSVLAEWLGLPPRSSGWAAVAAGTPGIVLQVLFAPAAAAIIGRRFSNPGISPPG